MMSSTKKQLKISVVIATYNCGSIIKNVLDSYISQSYVNKELIIIDGGSESDTIDVINQYKDSISYFISEPDKGVYDAMNKGLNLASGDFLIFMGADDHFISNRVLNDAVNYFTEDDCIYYGNVYRNTRNDIYRGKFNKYLLSCENICHQSIFYPKSVYKKNIYDLNYPIYADYIYNIRLWNKIKFVYIPICISYYNCKGLSGSGNDIDKYSRSFYNEVRNNLGLSCFILRHIYRLINYVKCLSCHL